MRFGFVKSIFQKVDTLVTGRGRIDESLFDDLEESLIKADVSVRLVTTALDTLRERTRTERWSDPDDILRGLRQTLGQALRNPAVREVGLATGAPSPSLYLFVGVNGVGKTTSIAKLTRRLTASGAKALLAAADTFRAGALEQLDTWADRLDVGIIKHRPGADPSAVVFDAIQAARARHIDYVLADTAGRIQTKAHLMEELRKVARVAERSLGRRPDEVLLVMDATTGQNGISQARLFTEAVPVSGIILTKLDGTARGGIVLSIADELGIPIKLVGSGERAEDLEDFDPEAFIKALLA